MPVSNKDLRTQLHRLYQQKLAVDDLIASLMRYQRRTMGKAGEIGVRCCNL
jgi:hypothetical protein